MKRIRSKFKILVIFSSFVFFAGCTSDYYEPIEVVLPETVSFSDNIIPIFNKSCNMSGCHNGSGPSPDLTEANAYNDLFANNLIDTIAPESSELYVKLVVPGTHDGKSSDEQRALILKWIQQGAKNN